METENAFFEIYSKKIQGCSLPQAEIKHPPKKVVQFTVKMYNICRANILELYP